MFRFTKKRPKKIMRQPQIKLPHSIFLAKQIIDQERLKQLNVRKKNLINQQRLMNVVQPAKPFTYDIQQNISFQNIHKKLSRSEQKQAFLKRRESMELVYFLGKNRNNSIETQAQTPIKIFKRQKPLKQLRVRIKTYKSQSKSNNVSMFLNDNKHLRRKSLKPKQALSLSYVDYKPLFPNQTNSIRRELIPLLREVDYFYTNKDHQTGVINLYVLLKDGTKEQIFFKEFKKIEKYLNKMKLAQKIALSKDDKFNQTYAILIELIHQDEKQLQKLYYFNQDLSLMDQNNLYINNNKHVQKLPEIKPQIHFQSKKINNQKPQQKQKTEKIIKQKARLIRMRTKLQGLLLLSRKLK